MWPKKEKRDRGKTNDFTSWRKTHDFTSSGPEQSSEQENKAAMTSVVKKKTARSAVFMVVKSVYLNQLLKASSGIVFRSEKNDALAAQRAASEAQKALIEKTKQEIAAKRKAMSDARADKAKKVREVEEATRKECKEILCREMAMARRE